MSQPARTKSGGGAATNSGVIGSLVEAAYPAHGGAPATRQYAMPAPTAFDDAEHKTGGAALHDLPDLSAQFCPMPTAMASAAISPSITSPWAAWLRSVSMACGFAVFGRCATSGCDDPAYRCGVDPASARWPDFDALIAEAHRLGLKSGRSIGSGSRRRRALPWFQESRAPAVTTRNETWYGDGPMPEPGSSRPTTGSCPGWAARAWRWEPPAVANFAATQCSCRDARTRFPSCVLPVRDACSTSARFWLARGVDGLHLDTASVSFHSGLENNRRRTTVPTCRYWYGFHRRNTDQPEALGCFAASRPLLISSTPSRWPEIRWRRAAQTMTEYRRRRPASAMRPIRFAMLGDRRPPLSISRTHMTAWQTGRCGCHCSRAGRSQSRQLPRGSFPLGRRP